MGNAISFSHCFEDCCPNDQVEELTNVTQSNIHEDEITAEIQAATQPTANRLIQNYVTSQQSSSSHVEDEESPMVTVTRITRYHSINPTHTGSLNAYQHRLTENNRRTPSPFNPASTILGGLQLENEAVSLLAQGKGVDAVHIFIKLGCDENTFFAYQEKARSRSTSPEEIDGLLQPSNK